MVDTRGSRLRERGDLLRAVAWSDERAPEALAVARRVWGRGVDDAALLNRLHVTLHRLRPLLGDVGLVVRRGRIEWDAERVVVLCDSPPRGRPRTKAG